MFRVLSNEEARKVTRWHAPDIPVSDNDSPVRTVSASSDVTRKNPLASSTVTAGVDLSDVSVDAVQASYDEGYAAGFAESNAARHDNAIKQLRKIVSELSASASCFSDRLLEMEIVGLSMDIARLVIKRELSTDPALIQDIVSAGLNQLPELNASVRFIYLHPLDAAVVRDVIEEQDGIQVLDDSKLEKGACRIESGASVLHAGIDDWLAVIGAQLGLPANDNVPQDGNTP